MKRLNKVDLLAGLFAILIGSLSIQEALHFEIGTARSIGAGYFPLYVGILLLFLGFGIIFIEGLRPRLAPAHGDETITYPKVRSIIYITAAIFAFSQLIERVGLVPAVAAAVFLSMLADKEIRPLKAILMTMAVPIVCVIIFQWAFSLQVQAFRWH